MFTKFYHCEKNNVGLDIADVWKKTCKQSNGTKT